MNEPVWIRQDVVLAIHAEILALHGGSEGVRNLELLSSTLGTPKNLFAYSDQAPSLARLAASYAREMVVNRPFVDGNERTAFTISTTFLRLNGLKLTASNEDRVFTFWNLADGIMPENALPQWFEQNTVQF